MTLVPTQPVVTPSPARVPAPNPAAVAASKPEAVVKLVNVHKRFGSLVVLDGINLELIKGQTTVVIGPSGTGKSVLLKHIVGLLRPDSGEVWFEDKRVDQLNEHDLVDVRTKIGFLFQMSALFDSMSVRDNICFPLIEHMKLNKKELNERCARVLQMVGLSGIENKMPADLSGGQRKRVGLARAIVLEPQMVLYDEPTTGLDPIRSDVINELIISLSKNLGITSLVVTHDMASARKIADRMIMLYEGKVVADGDPQSFCDSQIDVVERFVKGVAEPADLEAIHAGFEGPLGKTETTHKT